LAQVDYSRAIEIDINFGAAYLNRGVCHEFQQNFNKAVTDWQKAKSLGIDAAMEYIKYYE
jgi:hypothetical protein